MLPLQIPICIFIHFRKWATPIGIAQILYFCLSIQLCTCRNVVIYHQKVQSLVTVFLVYC